MRIKRLYIKDFGIFRNENLEDLDKDIIIIGGYNRAGKTSFMKLFRHLGFGFYENIKGLPKPSVEYEVSYDAVDNSGEVYNVEIKGKRYPQVKAINTDKDMSIEELYGNIDYFTYKQLFTISLDELQNISLENSKDISNMQSILLGAGFKEIIHIPKLMKEFQSEAKKLGGTKGNPSTGQFKVYNKGIKKGLELRKEASKQVETYYEKREELNKIELQLENIKSLIKSAKDKISVLGNVKSNYYVYDKLRHLEAILENKDKTFDEDKFKIDSMEKAKALKERYEEILYETEEKKRDIINSLGEEKLKDKLLLHKTELLSFNQRISGIKEKINNYCELKAKCIKYKEDISRDIAKVNESWIGDFSKIINIKTDIIENSKLSALVDEEKELRYKKRELEKELENLEVNIEILKKNMGNSSVMNIDKLISRYFYISLFIIVLGVIISFFNFNAGILFSLSGAVLGGVYIIIKHSNGNNAPYLANSAQLEGMTCQANQKKQSLDDTNGKLEEKRAKLESYKEILEIKEDISGELIKEYFSRIKDIKAGIFNLKIEIDKLDKEAKSIKESIAPMLYLLYEFDEMNKEQLKTDNEIINNSSIIFQKIEDLNDKLSLAEELDRLEKEKASCEDKIKDLIGENCSSDEILIKLESFINNMKEYKQIIEIKKEKEVLEKTLSNAFNAICSIESKDEFIGEFNKYNSAEEVEEELSKEKKNLKEYEDNVEKLIETKESLKYQLKDLYSTDSIEMAQEKIDEARKEMMPLAKRYATLRAAEFMLKKLQESFIEKTKDSLLKNASYCLREITSGQYESIQPVDDLSVMDFKTVLNDGSVKENSEVLSRATKEQLFLSVRLSRIMEMDKALPIVLDDSFVNFDEIHTRKVLKLLTKVSGENQLFITTCHPQIVEYASQMTNSIKYLKLENGRFSTAHKEELVKYLQVK